MGNRIDAVKLTATKNDDNAKVVITNDDDQTGSPGEAVLDLSVGSNTLTVTVTAENGEPLTYTIIVTRRAPSTDATLSDLELENASSGGSIVLSPGFSSGHLDYSASVEFPVSRVTVIPTKNDALASIKYLNDSNNELSDADGRRSGFQLNLVAGSQRVIKVEVTAESGTLRRQTYTLTVARACSNRGRCWCRSSFCR